MIQSMTAYARSETQIEGETLVWELRSVNHRYLDLALRLPEELRSLEPDLRTLARERLTRGKVECTLSFKAGASAVSALVLNRPLVKAIIDATHELEAAMNNAARISPMDILRWPGVASEPARDLGPVIEAAKAGFEKALEELVQMRSREGERLRATLLGRLQGIRETVARIRSHHPQVLEALREKVLSRLRELQVQPDTSRLEQELVFLAQKMDIAEELDRLDSHCREMADVLERSEAVGRRLDFLLQEFNREANTLASKASDVETTQAAVDLKVLIEQMREQVQNIE